MIPEQKYSSHVNLSVVAFTCTLRLRSIHWPLMRIGFDSCTSLMLERRECLRMQVIKQDPWKNCMHSHVSIKCIRVISLLSHFSPPFHYFRSLPWLGRLESQKCQEECQRSHGQCREMAGYSSGKDLSGKLRERALCIWGPAGIAPAVRLEKQGSSHWKDQDVKNREKEGKIACCVAVMRLGLYLRSVKQPGYQLK